MQQSVRVYTSEIVSNPSIIQDIPHVTILDDTSGLTEYHSMIINSWDSLRRLELLNNDSGVIPDWIRALDGIDHLMIRDSPLDYVDMVGPIMTTLRVLDLSSNHITEFPTLGLNRLEILDLSDNEISDIFDEHLQHLRVLNLSHNFIKTFDISKFGWTNLTRIDLRSNYLSTLEGLETATELESLIVTRNLLEYIPESFYDLVNMREISYNSNKLSSLSKNYFENMTLLRYLNLSSNFIEEVTSEGWDQLSSLKVLNLSNNRLWNIPQGIYEAPVLRDVIIKDNMLSGP